MIPDVLPVLCLDLNAYSRFRLVLLTGPSSLAGVLVSVFPVDPSTLDDLTHRVDSLGGIIAGFPYSVRTESNSHPWLTIRLDMPGGRASSEAILSIFSTIALTLLSGSNSGTPRARVQ